MRTASMVTASAIALLLGISATATALSQEQPDGDASRSAILEGTPGLPEVEPPPMNFDTAEEHYNYLLEQADGGTSHDMASIPLWDGLWSTGPNSMVSLFCEGGTLAVAMRPGCDVKEGVLTAEYEEHFRERRAEIDETGEQQWDRLTICDYPGVARWLWEPYVKEFVNTPAQTWLMNDFMNETRRVYINNEHINIDGQHSATGDSIGFWDGNALTIWTKWVNPADYLRGMPLTSNQFEMVETWEERLYEGGERQLVTQVTFYDPIALQAPQSAVYTHVSSPELEEAGVRIRNWECFGSSNSYQDEEGRTQFYLPGDPDYKDARGFTDFPDIPGQSRNPIFDPNGSAQQ